MLTGGVGVGYRLFSRSGIIRSRITSLWPIMRLVMELLWRCRFSLGFWVFEEFGFGDLLICGVG